MSSISGVSLIFRRHIRFKTTLPNVLSSEGEKKRLRSLHKCVSRRNCRVGKRNLHISRIRLASRQATCSFPRWRGRGRLCVYFSLSLSLGFCFPRSVGRTKDKRWKEREIEREIKKEEIYVPGIFFCATTLTAYIKCSRVGFTRIRRPRLFHDEQ